MDKWIKWIKLTKQKYAIKRMKHIAIRYHYLHHSTYIVCCSE